MSSLAQRVHDDLEVLNELAHVTLNRPRLPQRGTWVRCWDKGQECPLGTWHLVATTDGITVVGYRCAQVGIVTIMAALRLPARFGIQCAIGLPTAACEACLRRT